MQKKQNKMYRTIFVYVSLFLILSIIGIMCAFKIDAVIGFFRFVGDSLLPVTVGFIIAYLLSPAVRFFERKVFASLVEKRGRRVVRAMSTIVSFLILFIVIALIALLLIPQLLANYTELAAHGEEYIAFAQEFADKIIGNTSLFGDNSSLSDVLGADLDEFLGGMLVDSLLFADKFVSSIISLAGGFIDVAVNTVFSVICAFGISLYSDRITAYIKRITRAFLTQKQTDLCAAAIRSVDRAFGSFFRGRIFESAIVGVIALVIFYVTGMPYPPLLAVILAVFNLIPYFGSIFAGVVGGVLVFVAEPSMLVWFLAIDLIMEQIDGNVLAPRVLGETIGIHPLFVIVSITVMGNLLGIVGLIVGVPIASVLIEAIKYLTKKCEDARDLKRREQAGNTDSENKTESEVRA